MSFLDFLGICLIIYLAYCLVVIVGGFVGVLMTPIAFIVSMVSRAVVAIHRRATARKENQKGRKLE